MPDCAISARACRFAARILTLPALALLAAAALAQTGCVSKARYMLRGQADWRWQGNLEGLFRAFQP